MMADGEGSTIHLVDVFAKQIEMNAQLAVISEQLRQLPDHELRIRALERWRYALPASIAIAVSSGALGVAELIISARH